MLTDTRTLCEVAIVVLAIIAEMASVGYKIAIERDWIVVIAAQNKGLLASAFHFVQEE